MSVALAPMGSESISGLHRCFTDVVLPSVQPRQPIGCSTVNMNFFRKEVVVFAPFCLLYKLTGTTCLLNASALFFFTDPGLRDDYLNRNNLHDARITTVSSSTRSPCLLIETDRDRTNTNPKRIQLVRPKANVVKY